MIHVYGAQKKFWIMDKLGTGLLSLIWKLSLTESYDSFDP